MPPGSEQVVTNVTVPEQGQQQAVSAPIQQSAPAAAPASWPQATTQAPAPQAAAGEQLPPGMAFGNDGRVQVLSTSAFKRLKDEARDRGRREALEELAKAQGYRSMEEMQEALAQSRQQPRSRQQAQPARTKDEDDTETTAPPQQSKSARAAQRDAERSRREADDLKRQLSREVKGKRELQMRIDALEAETQLREAAIRVGVHDVDYALRLLTRDLEGKSEEELAKFDESAYFTGLRQSKPYLFGETVRPANTGTGVGNAPTALNPAEAAQVQAQGNQIDARKMDAKQFQEYLRAKGLNINL